MPALAGAGHRAGGRRRRLDVRAGDPVEGGHGHGAGVGAGRRVAVPGSRRVVGRGDRHRRREGSRLAPDRRHRANPARWGTCRIGYRVNERRMPATGLADLREAMRRVTQVSGIRFRYRGKTSAVPRRGYGGPGLNKIVVAWAPPKKSGGLLYPGVGGVGGTSQSGDAAALRVRAHEHAVHRDG